MGVPRPKLYEKKGREMGLFEPVNHLSSCCRDRGEVESCESFQGRALGYCATMHRLNWGENGVRVRYAAGRSFVGGFSSPNVDQQGYKSELLGGVVPPAQVPCKTND